LGSYFGGRFNHSCHPPMNKTETVLIVVGVVVLGGFILLGLVGSAINSAENYAGQAAGAALNGLENYAQSGLSPL
jgi:hypothetical protein